MENTKYDDKFYRLPKRLFKEEQFRSMTNEEKAHNLIYRSHQGLGEPKKISAVFRLYESYCKK